MPRRLNEHGDEVCVMVNSETGCIQQPAWATNKKMMDRMQLHLL